MKRITVLIGIIFILGLTDCASKHAYMSKPVGLGPERRQCDSFHSNDCDLVRNWEPSQLTSVGCWAHTVVTGGHIAWECRKPAKCARLFLNPDGSCKMPLPTPAGGRWIWKNPVERKTYWYPPATDPWWKTDTGKIVAAQLEKDAELVYGSK